SFASAMTSRYCVNHTVEICASLEWESLYSRATESEKARASRKCCAVPIWVRKRSRRRSDSASDGRGNWICELCCSANGVPMSVALVAVRTEPDVGACRSKRDLTWDAKTGPEAFSVL